MMITSIFRIGRGLLAAALISSTAMVPAWAEALDGVEGKHGIAMHGDLKYAPAFTHFDYVNPKAPKTGEIHLSAIGTYDNLNPFILKGIAAAGSLMIYNRLCTKSKDEPFTEYGQLARQMQMPVDRSWVLFELHPEARWHDGVPVTAADVVFSFKTLTNQGMQPISTTIRS